jgi:hypothetical protein
MEAAAIDFEAVVSAAEVGLIKDTLAPASASFFKAVRRFMVEFI